MRVQKPVVQAAASQLSSSPVWPGHENWENSHTNSRLSTLSNSRVTLILVWPEHENWENSHTNSRLSTLNNSPATFVLVWSEHESWGNFHTHFCFLSLIQFLSTSFSQRFYGLQRREHGEEYQPEVLRRSIVFHGIRRVFLDLHRYYGRNQHEWWSQESWREYSHRNVSCSWCEVGKVKYTSFIKCWGSRECLKGGAVDWAPLFLSEFYKYWNDNSRYKSRWS